MKKQITKVGSIQFTVNVPESIEEHEKLHGQVGATLAKAINYDVAHTILGKIRNKMADYLVKRGKDSEPPVELREIASHNDKGEPVFKATDTKWIDRTFAKLGIGVPEQATLYQDIADEVGYDVSGTRSSNKEFNQVDLRDAKGLMDAIRLGKTTFDRVKTNLETRNPSLDLAVDENGAFTVETLAAGLKVERARVEAERQGQLAGLL